jgi:hypothetical protein
MSMVICAAMRSIALCALGCVLAAAHSVRADNLIVDGSGVMGPATLNLSAATMSTPATPRRYDHVCIINGGRVTVDPYTKGSDKLAKGNLELIASSIYLDQTSSISVRGSGYRGQQCDYGDGMTGTEGGRGGCSVRDSGGGGAHFGRGGRGTIDDPTSYPRDFEDDCSNHFDSTMNACLDANDATAASGAAVCSAGPMNAGPSVAGVPVWHNIYEPEFGAAGGDKGCRDGDGKPPIVMTAGSGGGRVVLVGLSERGTGASPCGLPAGTVRIAGRIDANGKRGCGIENDSGGGGAGGTVLVVGQRVEIGASANISAAGGLGGDTRAGASDQPDYTDCPGTQSSGVCDDCGGGGGGGIISVLSVTSELDPAAKFNVSGANGGTCGAVMGDAVRCQGEAGGGAGELQLDGAYVGEFCDGYDNDFDGNVDENLGSQVCGLGSCAVTIPRCENGVPKTCVPTVSNASCQETAANARPRIAVVLDSSGSMLLNLAGYPTFGDGSVEHPGIDTDGDGEANDARLFLAREALGQVISAYPEIDFALARYHQDQADNRACQTATWFECQGLVASYDDPTDNSGPLQCNVAIGPDPDGMGAMLAPTRSVLLTPGPNATSTTECINYAGSCGPPRRGADILSGFGTPVRDMVRWLDGVEGDFDPSPNPGDYCLHSQGKDCELRGSGPTPLAGSLLAVEDYVSPIRTQDAAKSCRGYTTILVTDGAESCNGDPVAAAAHLYSLGIQVYVVAVSVLDSERASLNAIAAAGGPPASPGVPRTATFVSQPEQLVPALTSIIADSIRYESCNGMDDDCDGKVDEDFPGIDSACGDDKLGICHGTGKIVCNDTEDGTRCAIDMPGQAPGTEVCNSIDDNCNNLIDEGLDCQTTGCTPAGDEICNGKDDDCDMKVDESDPAAGAPCGKDEGECEAGTTRCVAGELRCIGGRDGMSEQCNGRDDDCDGQIDEDAPCPDGRACIEGACRSRCIGSEFSCPVGQACEHSDIHQGDYCVPSACALCKTTERCENDVCIDPCQDVSCDAGLICVRGDCRDCYSAGCPNGQLCYKRECQEDRCANMLCSASEYCFDGACVALCRDSECPTGQSCGPSGSCEADRCVGVTCGEDDVCRAGQCESNPCRTLACTVGNTCVPELGCIPDPCTVTVCPPNTLCSVGSQGEPRCKAPGVVTPPRARRFVSTGGAGLTSHCSVERVGAGSPPWAALSLLAIGLFARRRRAVRRRPGSARLARTTGLREPLARGACAGAVPLALALLGAGCKTDAFCLDCVDASNVGKLDAGVQSSDAAVIRPPDGGADDDGGGSGGDGSTSNPGCTPLGDEVCNQLDDDCDGKTDEDFDFATNVRHCGGCDQVCRSDNAETSCEAGECVVGDCLLGFGDLDSQSGCEYRCPVYPPAVEDCNGIDDDCDGHVDEQLAAPGGDTLCRHTPGTPCENVQVVCETREKRTTWFCAYPSSVDFDPVVPDGIVKEELRCDGLDNDCDGVQDEPWQELGGACDDGQPGACRDGGKIVCASDQKSTRCDLTLPPDRVPGAGPNAVELCNNLDDNCDGIVDNPGASDDKRVVDDMRLVSHNGTDYYIYTYEASRPDATGSEQGIVGARSCSRPGAKPWTLVSYAAASAACAASGKRLCTAEEWLWACQGDAMESYPYGSMYEADGCNGADHDTQSGGGLDNAVLATGAVADCHSPAGAFDLSGNVKEWTDDMRGMSGAPKNEPIYVVRGGSFESPREGLTCQTELSQATASTVLSGLGFRCCSDTAP